MYQYESEYDPEEAAAILAQREAEESAAAKREELQLNKERKSLSLDMLLHLMETVLNKVRKTSLSLEYGEEHLTVPLDERGPRY